MSRGLCTRGNDDIQIYVLDLETNHKSLSTSRAEDTIHFTVESKAYGPDSGIPGPSYGAIFLGILFGALIYYAESRKSSMHLRSAHSQTPIVVRAIVELPTSKT